MKLFSLFSLIALATVLPAAALAASEHAHDHGAAPATTAKPMASTPMSEGQVKKVDSSAAKITIAHGPLESLAMPAMTMTFVVKQPAELKKIKVGDKIRFIAEIVDGVMTVAHLEPAR